jgi:hypothetical protein
MLLANKGAIIASVVGGLVAAGVIVYFSAPSIILGPRNEDAPETDTSSHDRPRMKLLLLENADDNSPAIVGFDANNTKPIQLQQDAHIRFEAADHRNAEGMIVTARNLDTGEIQPLRKSYDVNNQFFVILDKSKYDIQVQATWAEIGSVFYSFDVVVV